MDGLFLFEESASLRREKVWCYKAWASITVEKRAEVGVLGLRCSVASKKLRGKSMPLSVNAFQCGFFFFILITELA